MRNNKKGIREFLSSYMLVDDISDDTDLFRGQLVNSLFAMQLVLFLEKEFNLTINNDELSIDNFRTIEHINEFINKKAI